MSPLAIFRTSWGIKLLPVWLLVLVYGFLGVTVGRGPFGTAALELNAWMQAACVPALAAALEGARYRRGGVLPGQHVRHPVRIMAAPVMLIIVVPICLMAVAMARLGLTLTWWMLLLGVVWLVGWVLLGLVLGLTLPGPVAGPLSFLTPFMVVLYGPAVEPLWVRYLSGYYGSCCQIGEVLDPRAASAGFIAAVGLLLLGLGALALRRWRWCRRQSVSVIGLLLGASVVVAAAAQPVKTMGPLPGVPRSDPQQCVGSPAVCSWSDYTAVRDTVAPHLRAAHHRWAELGVRLPGAMMQGVESSRSGQLEWVLVHPEDSIADIVATLAESVARAPCMDSGRQVPLEVTESREGVIVWLVETAGWKVDGASKTALEWSRHLRAQPPGEQGRVVSGELQALRQC